MSLANLSLGDRKAPETPAAQRRRLERLSRELDMDPTFRWYSLRRGGATQAYPSGLEKGPRRGSWKVGGAARGPDLHSRWPLVVSPLRPALCTPAIEAPARQRCSFACTSLLGGGGGGGSFTFRPVDVTPFLVAEAHANGMRGQPLQIESQLLIAGALVAKSVRASASFLPSGVCVYCGSCGCEC
jgi:hypothetical protein